MLATERNRSVGRTLPGPLGYVVDFHPAIALRPGEMAHAAGQLGDQPHPAGFGGSHGQNGRSSASSFPPTMLEPPLLRAAFSRSASLPRCSFFSRVSFGL